MTLYTGDLLPYGAGETWVVPRSVDLHNRYMKSVYKYIDMLRPLEDYDEIIRASRVALDIDAFDERLHLDLMDALVNRGRNNESLQQYRHATHIVLPLPGFPARPASRSFISRSSPPATSWR